MNKTKKDDSELQGTLEHIVFRSDETGFVVGRLKNKQQLITIAGQLTGANIGEYLLLKGSWEIHPEYGQQFKVNSFQAEQPITSDGIIKFLSNSLIKGIGPKTAERIVAHWGDQSLDIIENEPQKLREIAGIGKHKCDLISQGWQEKKSIKNLMLFLHNNGITASIAHKLYKEYGDQAYQIISSNPYKLAADIYGIGFHTADKIALKLGLEVNSDQRIDAALMHVLLEAAEDGHCFLEVGKLVDECVRLMSHRENNNKYCQPVSDKNDRTKLNISGRLQFLGAQESIITTSRELTDVELCYYKNRTTAAASLSDDDIVYLPPFYFAEINAAKRLTAINNNPHKALACFETVDWDKAFNWLYDKQNIVYSEEQKAAIIKCISSKVSILTGGPGTGKSTITSGIVKLIKAKNRSVLLAAPTGRAAKRLSEVTGINAQTIHRLLEFTWHNGLKFRRDADNPLEADLIIVDEVSMLDILLLNHLLKALKPESHLLLIGDADQLPSVGAGNVLKDLIVSDSLSVPKLTKIYRQSDDSYIVTNSHLIKSGKMPHFTKNQGDFFFFGAKSPERAAQLVIELVTKKIPESFGFSPINDIQVLAPMHKGLVGITELNRSLQATLNPLEKTGKELSLGTRVFRVNDRIIQLKNNYEKEVFNGDFGFIKDINREQQTITIEFESISQLPLKVDYEFTELDQITHSYAITIHKSQGSEFPVVVIPLTTQHYIMLQRNLFYTAVTRARKMVVIVGTQPAMELALKNNKSYLRNTRLATLTAYLSEKDTSNHQ